MINQGSLLLKEVEKIVPGTIVDLFILDLNSIKVGEVYYFYNGVDQNYGPVLFQGKTYQPFPIVFSGVKRTSTGSEFRPTLKVSNGFGLISNIIAQYNDLVGTAVYRRRTKAEWLGTNTTDTTMYVEEKFYIEQLESEDESIIQFLLSNPLDFAKFKLPGRTAVANTCPWIYKSTEYGSGCGWPGTDSSKWFDENDNPVVLQQDDKCGKRLSSCKARFGQFGELDYGGFPALGRNG